MKPNLRESNETERLFEISITKNTQNDSLNHMSLAARLRPDNLTEVIGQEHLLNIGMPLHTLINGSSNTSIILYGPPGSGKTTLATLISNTIQREFVAISAINSNVNEVKTILTTAKKQLKFGKQTVLFIDEIHRFSKMQQDALLEAVETGIVVLVAATTENPSFSVISPLLSRSLVLQLYPLTNAEIGKILDRAVSHKVGFANKIDLTLAAKTTIANLAAGDARKALNILEATVIGKQAESASTTGKLTIDKEAVDKSTTIAAVNYDKTGDQHYDVISAFIKSIRGSDVDAALHYLARMIAAGEDPRFIARRLIILASEDIGLADSNALSIATAAAQAVNYVGLPEGRLALAHAVIYLALAPKSNSVITAIDKALTEVKRGNIGVVPAHLRDGHYTAAKKLGNAVNYNYPHNSALGIVAQQYFPDPLINTDYYFPTQRGNEMNLGNRLGKLREIIRNKKGKHENPRNM